MFAEYLRLRFVFVLQLQQLVISGELPCSKEEAATLAGIQLHIEEAWPEETPPPPDNKLQLSPIDKKDTPKCDDSSDSETESYKRKEIIRTHRTKKFASSRRRGKLTVKHIICGSDYNSEDLIAPTNVDLNKYLPPDFSKSRKVRELIKVRQI